MADVAHRHGGDGGSQDPNRNQNTIPSICESSQPKKKRGRGRNIKLFKKCEQNKGDQLPIQVVDGARQYKFVGPQASDFVRFISNTIAKAVPFHFKNWQQVPQEFKDAVYPSLFDYFNLNVYKEGDATKWAGIQLGIIAECQSRYKFRKGEMKKHFIENGGYDDIERAKSCCPMNYDQQKWVDLIDVLFMNHDYKRRCIANKRNRQKQKYPSYHGTRSYAQYRYLEEMQTGSADQIGIFKKTHYKEGHGWANEVCEADWNKVQDELARSQRDVADSSSPVDHIEVFERALGQRRGHIRGVGRVVKNVVPEIASASPTPRQQQQLQDMQEEMQKMRQEMQEMRQQQQTQVQPFSHQAVLELMHQQSQQHQFQMQQMELQFRRQLKELKRKLPQSDEDSEDD